MNVLVEGVETRGAHEYVNAGRETISYRAPQGSAPAGKSGFVLDISGTVMDNSAYAGHGRTAEELIRQIGQEDVTARRNYMAVMSNSVSDEDFARLQKEGFHPGSTDIETVVTIVDEIKVALAKGGTEIAGYTDTVDDEVLKDITGSEAFANELKRQFAEKDIPLTQENIAAVTEAWKLLTQAGEPTESSVKYMVENDLAPAPENLYTAKYSAAGAAGRQGRGYYAAGSVAGYYARKPEEIDFDRLRPQMERVIEQAGYRVNEENLKDAEWLVEKGIPLNEETFSLLKDIRSHHFPVSLEDFMSSAACALADGTHPARADLCRRETYVEQAAAIAEQTAGLADEAADIVLARDLPLTLKNLLAVQNELTAPKERNGQDKAGSRQGSAQGQAVPEQTDLPENLRGRRLLEEVRLTMTVEANLKLLRRGFQIDTAPLEKLIEKLREAENSYVRALTGEVDETGARQKASLYEETLDVLQGIRFAPAAIVAKVSGSETLKDVYEHGSRERLAYEKAGQDYEAMMTQPRRDMGDSIQKAFRNVDDILESMKLETSEENRRAVRILGYNNLEVTEENIAQIKEKDELLRDVVGQMDPGRVLNMIREGINPLIMPLEELGNYFNRQEQDPPEQMESYSRFLYKLEKQKGITEEERSAYIGIYRLVRQIEKADDAAVGALWQTGAEFTLGNLLSALRSSKRGKMDYSVDERFGGVDAKETHRESISSQIAKGFAADAALDQQALEQLLEEAGDEQAGREFDHMLYEQIRSTMKSEEDVLRHLSDYEQPVTADHLLAAEAFLKNPGGIWKEFNRLSRKEPEEAERSEEVSESFLEEAGEEVIQALEDRDKARSAYEGLQERLQSMVERMAFSAQNKALDVKAMSTLYKQFTFMGSMAREENYEIPANIDGHLTSINLKIVHTAQQESRATVTFETQALGKTAAEFKLTGQEIEGFCVCSREEAAGLLREGQGLLEKKLGEEELKAGGIYFAAGEKLDLAEFSLKETSLRNASDKNNRAQRDADCRLLYRAARAFIGYVREMSAGDVSGTE
ncbi:MAG: hypothetical protein HFI96_04405 [Lachnospiraceae bacterium]|jgi:hypothetical protein|nr:hypothetical protein [Lachnospiraceae bacterium]MCI9095477.1 hypothetical protein [Lachnospiraceae bacterium]